MQNSTFAEKFKAEFPDRSFECYIAEQNMTGIALGLAAEGKIPVEDHAAAGGLGEAVASLGLSPTLLAARKIPRSGTPEELLKYGEISAQDIVDAVKGIALRK